MIGELQDNKYPNADSVYNTYASQASYMLITAMVMVSTYYGIMKPFNLMPSNPRVDEIYDGTGLQCRFPKFFKSWREYENIHILFWAGKDTAWNFGILPMWIIFAIPTFLIAFDFMWVSLMSKRGVIDHAHYVAQFMWVFANAVWALGEFTITPNHDDPIGNRIVSVLCCYLLIRNIIVLLLYQDYSISIIRTLSRHPDGTRPGQFWLHSFPFSPCTAYGFPVHTWARLTCLMMCTGPL
jgi:hypothetical protein